MNARQTPRPSRRDQPIPTGANHDDLRAHLLELFSRLITVPVPADQLIGRFFRMRPKLPPGARGFIAATVYALLRRRYRTALMARWAAAKAPAFEWPEPAVLPGGPLTPAMEATLGVWRWLYEDLGAGERQARELAETAATFAEKRPTPRDDRPPPSLRIDVEAFREFTRRMASDPGLEHAQESVRRAAFWSLPIDVADRWVAEHGAVGAESLALAMGEPAPLDLRVNTLKTTREALRERLLTLGHEAEPTPISPDGLRLVRKANLFSLAEFTDGHFEVQDEGSQCVSLLLDPHPNWRVLDACAGGGGKTLHLSALMKNKGDLFATDRDPERLDPLRKRLRRSGSGNIRIAEKSALEPASFNAVLVDAPCLGFGTLRRNPDMLWRGPLADRLVEISAIQLACLQEFAPFVRPGGLLVYATCSLEPEETSGVIARFRESAPEFEPQPLDAVRARHGLGELLAEQAPGMVRLRPDQHGTDGFFVAVLRLRA